MFKNFFILGVSIIMFASLSVAYAKVAEPFTMPCPDNLPCIQEDTQKSSAKVNEFLTAQFAVKFFSSFLGLSAAAAVVFIIVGGVQMHLSFGEDEQIGQGKKTITWAVIGLVISILAIAIVQIISRLQYQL